jgi:hypothetical protein
MDTKPEYPKALELHRALAAVLNIDTAKTKVRRIVIDADCRKQVTATIEVLPTREQIDAMCEALRSKGIVRVKEVEALDLTSIEGYEEVIYVEKKSGQ